MPRKSKEADLQLAIQAKKRDPHLSYRHLARIFTICATTLKGRMDGNQPQHLRSLSKRNLTQNEEDTIARRVIDLDSRAFPPRLRYVEEMANVLRRVRDAQPVGKNWVANFIRRRPDLRTRLNRRIDYIRTFNEDPDAYNAWFKLVGDTIAKYGIQMEDIYNFDETGFLMGMILTGMVVTSSERRGRPRQAQQGDREWVTVVQAINSQGWTVPPYIIFAGKVHLASWYRNAKLPRDWKVDLSSNGWITNEIGVEWVKHFNQHTQSRTKGTKRLLILDGHESHHSMDFEAECAKHGIIPLCMPSHSSHRLQPLDLVPFSVLKRVYSQFVERLMRRHQTHVAKEDFLLGFLEAFEAAFTKKNIQSGFKAAGICPLDADRVISALDVVKVTHTPSPDPELPPPSWVSKTPTTSLEADSQSTLIKNSVQRHQNSSPTHIFNSIDSIAKATHAMMHENALLRRENEELRETNHMLSKRRRRKNKQLQHGGSLSIADAQVIRDTRGDASEESSDEGESSQPIKRRRTGQRHCGICGGTGHNARTCQIEVETDSEQVFD
jgi:hypothetical protein